MTGGITSIPVTIAPTQPGSLLVVVVMTNSADVTALTDSASQSYARDNDLTPGTERRIIIFSKANTAAGVTSVTVTTTSYSGVWVIEYSGMPAADVVDVNPAGQSGTSATVAQTFSTNAVDVIVAALAGNDATPNSDSIDSPFSFVDNGGGGKSWAVTDSLDVAAGSHSPTIHLLGSVAWDICCVGYKCNPAATLEQSKYEYRDDDGDKATATALAGENTTITRAPALNTRLRVQVNATGDPASGQFQLEYRKQGSSQWHKAGE